MSNPGGFVVRKVGRPLKRKLREGEMATLGTRVTIEMKRRLMRECERNGRSLSHEIEIRLERSFDMDKAREEI